MHRQRWITGIVAVPIIYLLVATGGTLFFLLIAAASVLTLLEYYRAVFGSSDGTSLVLMQGVGLVFAPVIVGMTHRGFVGSVPLVLSLDLVLAAALTLPIFKNEPGAPFLAAKQVFGLVYVPVALSFLLLIRSTPDGANWLFLILCVVAAGDIGAFYTGTYLGRHKLCPWVSPQKTIEGSLGGLASNVVVAMAFKAAVIPVLPSLSTVVLALLVGAAGQVGDLYASEIKRAAGIKDSGTLLPGHGGFLDRLDALLFAAPLAYLLKISVF